MREVAIVGMGAVTPIGYNVNDFWQGLKDNKCGVQEVPELKDRSKVKIAGSINGFELEHPYLKNRAFSRCSRLLLGASYEALQDAELIDFDLSLTADPRRVMTVIGTWAGPTFEHDAYSRDFVVPQVVDELLSQYVSQKREQDREVLDKLLSPVLKTFASHLPRSDNLENILSCDSFSERDKAVFGLHDEMQSCSYEDYIKRKELVWEITPDRIASIISHTYNVMGETQQVGNACASGITAIGEAYWKIRSGRGDIAIAGGADSANYPYMVALFSKMDWLKNCDTPEAACKPLNSTSDYFVQAEGAGILVLEELEHAVRRGANIRGVIKGYAATMNPDVRGELTGDGYYRALRTALELAKISTQEVQYVNSCSVGFWEADQAEILALKRVFGERMPYVSSVKGHLGHPYAAAGPIQAITGLKSMETGILVPTRNLDESTAKYLFTDKKEGVRIDNVVASGHGCGNHCAELVIGKYGGKK